MLKELVAVFPVSDSITAAHGALLRAPALLLPPWGCAWALAGG